MRKGLLVAVLVAGLGAAACSSGGGGGTPTASSTGGVPANCTDESSGNVFIIGQKNTRFHPSCLIVRSAQSVHIVNEDGVTHNFTIAGTQVNVDIPPGKFFNGESPHLKAGTYQFFCRFHKSLGMTGTIVVK